MREIKFRAWDTETKTMRYEGFVVTYEGQGIYVGVEPYHIFGEYVFLMQYTGLKDKNGKEIYEGDIVRYKIFTEFHKEETIGIGPVEYTVEKDGRVGFAPMVWHTAVDDGYYNYEIEDIEVIGNIYENKELLK